MMFKMSSPMQNKKSKRVIGIDPGYGRLGISVVEKKSPKDTLLFSTCVETDSKTDIYSRFLQVGNEIEKIIKEYKPEEMALESLFMAKNQKTAMRVAEVRGILIFQALRHGLTIHEYTPLQIKMAITGDGTSDKTRIIKMIKLLIELPNKIKLDDEYDAIAVSLTHLARNLKFQK